MSFARFIATFVFCLLKGVVSRERKKHTRTSTVSGQVTQADASMKIHVCVPTISYANETISYQPDIISFVAILSGRKNRALQADNNRIMKFHFYLHAMPEVGNQQHSI